MAQGCACGQPEPQHCFQGNIAPHSPAENCYFYWHLCCSRIWKRAWRSFMAWSACSCCHWWKKKKKTQINFTTAASVLCITMGEMVLWCSGLLPYMKCHCSSWRKSQGSKMKRRNMFFFFLIAFLKVCNKFGRRRYRRYVFAGFLLEEITDICVYCWIPSY